MATWLKVMIVILIILLIASVILYFVGRRLQNRQIESQKQMEAIAQTVSLLVIDKKRLKMKEAGLPKVVMEQTPRRYQRLKMPIVKAKVGNRIMTLIADEQVYDVLPVKTECKVVISGIYITAIKSVRGGSVPAAPAKKKNIFQRTAEKLRESARPEVSEKKSSKKK